jgi:hypothetical protein
MSPVSSLSNTSFAGENRFHYPSARPKHLRFAAADPRIRRMQHCIRLSFAFGTVAHRFDRLRNASSAAETEIRRRSTAQRVREGRTYASQGRFNRRPVGGYGETYRVN